MSEFTTGFPQDSGEFGGATDDERYSDIRMFPSDDGVLGAKSSKIKALGTVVDVYQLSSGMECFVSVEFDGNLEQID